MHSDSPWETPGQRVLVILYVAEVHYNAWSFLEEERVWWKLHINRLKNIHDEFDDEVLCEEKTSSAALHTLAEACPDCQQNNFYQAD